MNRFADALLARPRLTSLVVGVAMLVVLLGLGRLQADMDARSFFAIEDAEAQAFEAFQAAWGREEGLVTAVVPLDAPDLDAIEAVARALEQVPGVTRVHAASRVLRAGPRIGALSVPVPLHTLAVSEEALLADRHLVPRLLSADGRHAAVWVWIDAELDDPTALRPVVQALEAAVGPDVLLGGMPVVRAGLLEVILVNQAVLGPLVVIGVVLLLAWWYRRPHGVVLPLTAALLPPALLLGVMGWVGEPLGILNQVYFTLLPVIAVADALHLLGRYHEERAQGVHQAEAVRTALHRVGGACLLTTVTTAVGLGSLVLAPMPLLSQFGLFGAVGVGLAYVAFVTVLPLTLLAGFASPAVAPRLGGLERLATATLGHPVAVVATTLGVLVAAVVLGSHARVDAVYTDRLPRDHPSTLAARLSDQALGGAVEVPFELESDSSLLDADVLDALEGLEQELLADPRVRAVEGPARGAARLSLAAGGPDHPPDDAARLVDLPGPWREGGRQGLLSLGLRDAGAVAVIAAVDDFEERLDARLGPLGVRASPRSSVAIFYESMLALSHTLIWSLGAAFLACLVLIGVLFRSVRFAALAGCVNAVPIAVGLAVVGAHGWRLDALSAVVFTLGVGVCVDDTIHFLVRYREERLGHDAEAAARRAIVGAGGPMVVTTLVLASGLGVNALSTFPHNQVFAWLGASMVLAALPCDLLLLPVLVVITDPERRAPARSRRPTALAPASRTSR